MTDHIDDADRGKGDANQTRNYSDVASGSQDARGDRNTDVERDSKVNLTRENWEQVPKNPDPLEDLGYDLNDWEQFQTLDDTDQVMFLPENEAALKEDAFIVAHADTLADLGDTI